MRKTQLNKAEFYSKKTVWGNTPMIKIYVSFDSLPSWFPMTTRPAAATVGQQQGTKSDDFLCGIRIASYAIKDIAEFIKDEGEQALLQHLKTHIRNKYNTRRVENGKSSIYFSDAVSYEHEHGLYNY